MAISRIGAWRDGVMALHITQLNMGVLVAAAANAAIAKPALLMCVELAALMAPIWGRRSAALVVTCGAQFVLVDPSCQALLTELRR